LLYLIRHLRFAHLREVHAHFFVDSLQTLEVPLCHLAAGSCQEDGLKDEGEKLLAQLGFFEHDFVAEVLPCFDVLSDGDQEVVFNIA
jgi:hypothetical protein